MIKSYKTYLLHKREKEVRLKTFNRIVWKAAAVLFAVYIVLSIFSQMIF